MGSCLVACSLVAFSNFCVEVVKLSDMALVDSQVQLRRFFFFFCCFFFFQI